MNYTLKHNKFSNGTLLFKVKMGLTLQTTVLNTHFKYEEKWML